MIRAGRVGPALVLAAMAMLAGCAAPRAIVPPPVVPTIPVTPPPPEMPAGGYPGMTIPKKMADGRYVTPNIEMTDAAAVWHLRGALNVAALACDKAGGGTVDPYNAWLRGRAGALDRFVRQYLKEWEETGWGDWQDAYDNHQTRLYNFYGQPAIRVAFCRVAAVELAGVGAVPEAELPGHARGALARLDQPFLDFFKSFDAWRAYYEPTVAPPPVVATQSTPAPAFPAAPAVPAVEPPRLTVPTDILDGPGAPD